MKSVQVVFPVLRGTRRFLIERGRRWSVVEHLLLGAVTETSRSVSDLAAESGLPRRIVIEAFIRLMRAGWVEIAVGTNGVTFSATESGMQAALRDQLPAATVTEAKWRSFAIDQVTGCVFRGRELDARPRSRLPVPTTDNLVGELGSIVRGAGELGDVFSAIEGEDEYIVGIDRNPEKLLERFAVVTVRDDVIEGLPARASPRLRDAIKNKAKELVGEIGIPKADAGATKPVIEAPVDEVPVSVEGVFDHKDVIIDGDDHKRFFISALKNSKERVLIHSTFISETRVPELVPLIIDAAQRGVKIDILWGQDDIGTATTSSRNAATKLQSQILATVGDLVTVHQFSTRSHAKLLIADSNAGGWFAIVGSCNWLASDFSSFETSVRLRDPKLVGSLVGRLGNMARGRAGLWHELAVEMTILGRKISGLSSPNGAKAPIRILSSADHAKLVLEARDRVERRIFVLSHRLGIAGKPVTLLPTLSAVLAKKVDAKLYYGRTTGVLSGANSAELREEFSKKGVSIEPVHRPRLHAKVLAWDDNFLAVSSQNWLSADPSDAAVDRELGVFVESPSIASHFVKAFEKARTD